MAFSTTQIAIGTPTDCGAQIHGGKTAPHPDIELQIQGTGFGDALSETLRGGPINVPSDATLRMKTLEPLPSVPHSTSDQFVSDMSDFPAPSLESQTTASLPSVLQFGHLEVLIPKNEAENFGRKTEDPSGSDNLDESNNISPFIPTSSQTQAATFKKFHLVPVIGEQKTSNESDEIVITSWGPHARSNNAALIPISTNTREVPKIIMQIPMDSNFTSELSSVPLDTQKQYSGPPTETTPKASKSAPFYQSRNSNATVTGTNPIVLPDNKPTENSRASAIEYDAHQMTQHDRSVTWEQVRPIRSVATSADHHDSRPSKIESVAAQNQPATLTLQEKRQPFELIPAANEERSDIGRESSKHVKSDDPSPMTPSSEVVMTQTSSGSEKTPATAPFPTNALKPAESIEQLQMFPQLHPENTTPLSNANSPTLVSAVLSTPAHQPTQLPQHISMQICGALEASGNQDIEIRLDPEELGRIRIVLSTKEGGMNVIVFSDRPEVLDLMRRNSDMLEADFSDIGYESANFSFQQEHDDKSNPKQDVNGHWDIEETVDLPTSQQQSIRDITRLDLRI